MSQQSVRTLLPITIGSTDLLIDADRVVATESSQHVQRNPTERAPWGWLLGSTDGVEVHSLTSHAGGSIEAAPETGRVLIVEQATGDRWGLLVDRASKPIEVGSEAIWSIDLEMMSGPFVAVVHTVTGSRLLLDPDRVLPTGSEPEPSTPTVQAPTPVAQADASMRMVWFPIHGAQRMLIGLSARQVVEIRSPLAIAATMPSARPHRGYTVYENQAIPVADYAPTFGLSATPGIGRRTLIARFTRSDHRVALPIGDEVRTVDLPVDNRPCKVDGQSARWLRGAFEVEHGLLLVPDLDALTG